MQLVPMRRCVLSLIAWDIDPEGYRRGTQTVDVTSPPTQARYQIPYETVERLHTKAVGLDSIPRLTVHPFRDLRHYSYRGEPFTHRSDVSSLPLPVDLCDEAGQRSDFHRLSLSHPPIAPAFGCRCPAFARQRWGQGFRVQGNCNNYHDYVIRP